MVNQWQNLLLRGPNGFHQYQITNALKSMTDHQASKLLIPRLSAKKDDPVPLRNNVINIITKRTVPCAY